jgi:ABC-type nitrate/sulfonate/bicarbonate transport system substrate-binding protein
MRVFVRFAFALLALATGPLAASAQTKAVTLAVQPSTDVPQILLAMERKLWDTEKVEVRVVTFSTGREALEALLGGQANFAVLTEYPAVIGILRGQKFSVLADMSRYQGLRATASKKWMTLSSPKDLDGRKVGTTLGTNVEFVTSVMLREGAAKAEVVNAAPADTVPALVRGDIQASVMFPNLYAQAKKLLGPDYQEIRTKSYTSHSLLVGATATLESRKAETEGFLKGLLAADKIVAADPAAGQAVVLAALKGVMTPEVLKELWVDYDYRLTLTDALPKLMSQEATWILERGAVKASTNAASVKALRGAISDGFLARLSPGAVGLSN